MKNFCNFKKKSAASVVDCLQKSSISYLARNWMQVLRINARFAFAQWKRGKLLLFCPPASMHFIANVCLDGLQRRKCAHYAKDRLFWNDWINIMDALYCGSFE
jgi:hypothetical protein